MREIQGSIKSQLDECATNNREYLSIQNFVGKIENCRWIKIGSATTKSYWGKIWSSSCYDVRIS